jgi:tyrosyl-tRNA synthetase
MDVEQKLGLVLRPPTEEIVTAGEFRELFESKAHPTHYIGFEISGFLHLGTLIVSGNKIRDLIDAGVRTKVFLADWHSVINNKLGGDWDRIKAASDYYREAFQTYAPGVEVVTGSELYHGNDDYWKDIIRFGKHVTLNRASRTLTIMGRSMKDTLDIASYLYPCMQAVDIHYLDADIAHAGIDQRKVHMLAREVYPALGWKPPVALHHHILLGLQKPEAAGLDEDAKLDTMISAKMSKSKPRTAIFIHDDAQTIQDKLARAWCPEGSAELNPVLELVRYIVFHDFKEFHVERPSKFGGPVTYYSYEEVEGAYVRRDLHPADLKRSTADYVDKVVADLRKKFEGHKRRLEEIMRD